MSSIREIVHAKPGLIAAAVAVVLLVIVAGAAVAVGGGHSGSVSSSATLAPGTTLIYEESGTAVVSGVTYSVSGTVVCAVSAQSGTIYLVTVSTSSVLSIGSASATYTDSPFGSSVFPVTKGFSDFTTQGTDKVSTCDGIKMLTDRQGSDVGGDSVIVRTASLRGAAMPYQIIVSGDALNVTLTLSAYSAAWQNSYTQTDGLITSTVCSTSGTRTDGMAIIGTLTITRIAEYRGGYGYSITETYESGHAPAADSDLTSTDYQTQASDTPSYLGYVYAGVGYISTSTGIYEVEKWTSGYYTYYTDSNAGGWYAFRIAVPGYYTMDICVPGFAIASDS